MGMDGSMGMRMDGSMGSGYTWEWMVVWGQDVHGNGW